MATFTVVADTGRTVTSLVWTTVDVELSIPTMRGTPPVRSRNLIVRAQLADGTVGYGEAAPYPGASRETLATTVAALLQAATVVHGRDVDAWRWLCRELTEHLPEAPAARCGVVQALVDAGARRRGMSLTQYLGGTPQQLRTDMTVVNGDVPHAAAAAASAVAAGFTCLKAKVAGPWQLDVERIVAIAAAAPGAALRAEGNGRYNLGDAVRLVEGLRRAGIELELFEQPTPARRYRDLVRLERETGTPVCADESVRTFEDFRRLADAGGVHALNVKPMLWGVTGAIDLVEEAAGAGVSCLIGGMSETVVSTSFSAALAAAYRPEFGYADLDGPWFMSGLPVSGGIRYAAGCVDVPDVPGTGIDASAAFRCSAELVSPDDGAERRM